MTTVVSLELRARYLSLHSIPRCALAAVDIVVVVVVVRSSSVQYAIDAAGATLIYLEALTSLATCSSSDPIRSTGARVCSDRHAHAHDCTLQSVLRLTDSQGRQTHASKAMSCWVSEHTIRVPSYHNTGGKLFYAIELTKRTPSSPAAARASMRTSFQSSMSSSSDRHFTTYRSYSQFRELWKTLAGESARRSSATQVAESGSSTFSRLRTRLMLHSAIRDSSSNSQSCRCDGDACSFHTLYDVMRVVPFPSRRLRSAHQTRSQRKESALNARRAALEHFIRNVYSFFATFPDALLRERLTQHTPCTALMAFATFLQADVHFPLCMTGALRQPLALHGWRQQCANKMMAEDNANNDDDDDQELTGTRSTLALAKAEPAAPAPTLALLPGLNVKTVKVETMYTFMEEFCEHVLSQYAHDMVELSDPELTPTRRWEICLYVACRIGHTYAVQLILFNYADANARMADGSTCLHIAARMGHTDIVDLLLDDGASVNRTNDAGVTPLIAACRNGCVDVAKRLLHAGASINACSARGTYPLHAAIVSQNVEIVQLLVESGADVNVMTASGITPLHFAAKLGSLEISELLLQHRADVARRTKNDSDAMMIASANGHTRICELLQRVLAQVNRQSRARSSANGSAPDDSKLLTRSRQGSKTGEMVRLHSQRLTARQCA